jgi:hypothetical protein
LVGDVFVILKRVAALTSHWLSEAPVRLLQEVLLRWTALKDLREEFGETEPVTVKDE